MTLEEKAKTFQRFNLNKTQNSMLSLDDNIRFNTNGFKKPNNNAIKILNNFPLDLSSSVRLENSLNRKSEAANYNFLEVQNKKEESFFEKQ